MYALMGYAVETIDAAAVARFGRAQAADAQVTAATAFVEPEVLAVGRDRLRDWSVEEPALHAYEHYFDDLFRRAAHTRSAEVEEIMGLVSDPFSGPFAVYSALVDSDVAFAPAVPADGDPLAVTQGSIDALLASPDRALRRSAWESYADGYLGVRNALAANLASAVKQAVFSARVRRYESPLAASLSRSNVPLEVFDNLIAAFVANLPTWHRYWRLRRSIYGVEQLAPVRRHGAARGISARARIRAVRRLDLRVARATRRRVRRHGQARLPRGALGGRLSHRRQDGRRVLCRRAGNRPVHRDELRRDGGQPRDARPRARPLDALVSRRGSRSRRSTRRYTMFVAEVASNFHQALLRAHLLDDGRRSGAAARRARRGDGELPPLLLHHADARALRAGAPRARRSAARG